MHYAQFKTLGMFVGSGAVEAGCKSIVAQRCKLSGMRWTVSGATGILTLRCLEASDRWEQIWHGRTTRRPPPEPASEQVTTPRQPRAAASYPPVTYIHVPHPAAD